MWFKLLVLVGAVSFSLASLTPRKLYKTQNDENEVQFAPFKDPFDNIDYRLPNDTKPIRYEISLATDIHSGNFTFTGRVAILIQAIVNSTEITLHSRQLTIVNVALQRSSGATIQSNVSFTQKDDTEFLILKPTRSLVAGTNYSVIINYIGNLRNDDAGFYRSSYMDISGTTKWLATTQFESTDARHAFPW